MKLMQIWQCTKYFYISKYFQSKSQWEKSKRSTLLPCDKSCKAFPSFHQTTVKKLHSKTVVLAVVSPINQTTAKTTEMLYKFSSQTTALNYRLLVKKYVPQFLTQRAKRWLGLNGVVCKHFLQLIFSNTLNVGDGIIILCFLIMWYQWAI
mgnify:CR=1 FL=1